MQNNMHIGKLEGYIDVEMGVYLTWMDITCNIWLRLLLLTQKKDGGSGRGWMDGWTVRTDGGG